jgi:hypothetical protein
MASATQVVTKKVRFSYLHVFEAYANNGGDPKYSVTLLINKKDKETTQRLQAAAAAARAAYKDKNGKALPPEADALIPGLGTLHDGDGQRPGGDDFGSECKGCYVITATSKNAPKLVDAAKNEILDRTELYSGCYGKAILNAFGYKQSGNAGVSFGLTAIQKTEDGEPLGGAVADVNDFDDEDEELF